MTFDRSKMASNYLFAKETFDKVGYNYNPYRNTDGFTYTNDIRVIKMHSKDIKRSMNLLHEIVNNAPDHLDALILLGKYELNFGDHKGVIELLEKALISNPDNLELNYILGQIYQKIYNFEKDNEIYQKVIDYLKKVYKSQPNQKVLKFLTGFLLSRFNEDKVISKDNLEIIEAYLEKNPKDNKMLIGLGNMYFKHKEYAKALSIYQKLKLWHNIGQCYIKLNNNIKAIQIYEDNIKKLEKMKYKFFDYKKILYDLYIAEGFEINNVAEVMNFVKVRKEKIAQARNLHRNGENLMEKGKIDKAIEKFDQSLKFNPISLDSRLFLTVAKLNIEGEDTTREMIDAIKSEYRGDPSFWSDLARAYELLGDYNNAIKFYNKYFEFKPQNNWIKSQFGLVLSKANRFQEAINVFEDLIKRSNLFARNNLGLVYSRMNNHEKALEIFIEALDRNKHANSIIMNIVNELDQLENFDMATAYLQVILRRNPNDKSAKEKLELIQKKRKI